MPLNLPPTRASWFDIWAAGVAVNTMCVQHGFTGTSLWLGKFLFLSKRFSDAAFELCGQTRGDVQGMGGLTGHLFR